MSEQHLEDRVLAIWQTRRAQVLYWVLRAVIRVVGRFICAPEWSAPSD